MPLSPYIPLTQCRICKHLKDESFAAQKYGWTENNSYLPEAEEALEWLGEPPLGSRFVELKRCPVCETYYRYELDYEFLVNGSEDEQTLTRLTPTDVRDKLSKEKYDQLIAHFKEELTNRRRMLRYYAAKSLTAHYWSMKEIKEIAKLLKSHDPLLQKGALNYLSFEWPPSKLKKKVLSPLLPVLIKLKKAPDPTIRWEAGAVLKQLEHPSKS